MGINTAELLTLLLALLGVGALLLASVGVLRLPDTYTRLHAAAMARTLGIGALLLGVALYDWSLLALVKLLALFGLFLLAAPVAAQALGRAAYLSGSPPTVTMEVDELEEVYDAEHRQFH